MFSVGEFIVSMIVALLTMAVSGYILIVHLLFKELHNLFGKLQIIYDLFVVSLCTITIIWVLLLIIPFNSQITCHIIRVILMILLTGSHTTPTYILTYLTNLMYCSYKLKSEMSKRRSKFLQVLHSLYIWYNDILYFSNSGI